jgi:hypothetical protein
MFSMNRIRNSLGYRWISEKPCGWYACKQSFINGDYQGGHEQEEIDEPAFQQKLQETYLDAEAVIGIAGEIVVGRLDIEKIGLK